MVALRTAERQVRALPFLRARGAWQPRLAKAARAWELFLGQPPRDAVPRQAGAQRFG